MSFNTVDLHRIKTNLISPRQYHCEICHILNHYLLPAPLWSQAAVNRTSEYPPKTQLYLSALSFIYPTRNVFRLIFQRWSIKEWNRTLKWYLLGTRKKLMAACSDGCSLSRYSVWQRNHLNMHHTDNLQENWARKHFQLGSHFHPIIQD